MGVVYDYMLDEVRTDGGSGGGGSSSGGGLVLTDVDVEVKTLIELDVVGGTRYLCGVDADGSTIDPAHTSPQDLQILSIGDTSVECQIWIHFGVNSTAIVHTPASLNWIGEPSFESEKSYIISIQNNVAVACEYTPGVTE